MHVVVLSVSVFHVGIYGSQLTYRLALFYVLYSVPVGPLMVPRTFKHKSKYPQAALHSCDRHHAGAISESYGRGTASSFV